MTSTHSPERPPSGPYRQELRGYATGILVLSFFAFTWAGWGVSVVSPTVSAPVIGVAVACCAFTAAFGLLLHRRARYLPVASARPEISRRYWLVVSVEYGGLFATAAILGATGNAEWIPVAVCAGVGMHFFPLGRLFGVRSYRVTGTVMLALAVAAVVAVRAAHAPAALATEIPGFGAALTLWTNAAVMLVSSQLVSRGLSSADRSAHTARSYRPRLTGGRS
jgi:hypothetical protein